MCLAVPARVTALLDDGFATVDTGGVKQRVCVVLLDDLRVDDFVIVHVGYALTRLDPQEAQRTLELMDQLGQPAVPS